MSDIDSTVTNAQSTNITERKRWLLFGLPFTFTTYTLQNKKLLLKEGFFNTVENEILLYRIVDITLKRSLLQRMFGLGNLTIEAQDKTHPTLLIKNIKRVRRFKDTMDQAIEDDKIRLRVRRGELIDSKNEEGEIDQNKDSKK